MGKRGFSKTAEILLKSYPIWGSKMMFFLSSGLLHDFFGEPLHNAVNPFFETFLGN